MNVAWYSCHKKIRCWPYVKRITDDMCQTPHWGYILKGKMTINFKDYKETISVGEAYYLAPGHIPMLEAGTEMVEFSPKE